MKRRYTVIVLFLLMLPIIELAARLALPREAPPPYPDDLWFTSAFQAEYTFANWQWTDTTLYMLPRDRAGRYVNYRGGFRVTVGQPPNAPTLWMVGSSTMLSGELPDAATIPSQVQGLVGSAYRVVNVGAPAATVSHEYQRLITLPVISGDVVLLYDGLMDVDALYMHQRETSIIRCIDPPMAWIVIFCKWLLSRPADPERAVARYRETIGKAQHWAESRGAAFIHVLQPMPFTLPLTDYERWIMREYPGMDAYFETLWPAMQRSETGHDATGLLDECRGVGECWFYPAFRYHVNAAANRVIAAELAKVIERAIARYRRG